MSQSLSSSTTSQHHDWFLRFVSIIYFLATFSYYFQFPALNGSHGLLPFHYKYDTYTRKTPDLRPDTSAMTSESAKFYLVNFMENLVDISQFGQRIGVFTDSWILFIMQVAIVLSFLGTFFARFRSFWCYLFLLSIYSSLVKGVGNTFMWFQWDILLLEIGLIACLISLGNIGGSSVTSARLSTPMFLVRVVSFKLMFMSGLTKILSECPTWLGLSAVKYHYASQCIPTPLAWYFHNIPSNFTHEFSVAAILVSQFLVSLTMLLPIPSVGAAIIHIGSQILIILTGNYNYFNLLSIFMCLEGLIVPKRIGIFNFSRKYVAVGTTLMAFSALAYGLFFRYFAVDFSQQQMYLRWDGNPTLTFDAQNPTKIDMRLFQHEVAYFLLPVAVALLFGSTGIIVLSDTFRIIKSIYDKICARKSGYLLRLPVTIAKTVIVITVQLLTISASVAIICVNAQTLTTALFDPYQKAAIHAHSDSHNVGIRPHITLLAKTSPVRQFIDKAARAVCDPSPQLCSTFVNQYGLFRRMTGVGSLRQTVTKSNNGQSIFPIIDHTSRNQTAFAALPLFYVESAKSRKARSLSRNGAVVDRPEVIIEGTYKLPSPSSSNKRSDGNIDWIPLEFDHKMSTNFHQAPTWIAPLQPRLDWQMWFAALSPSRPPPWLMHFVHMLIKKAPKENAPLQLLLSESARRIDKPFAAVRLTLQHVDFSTLDQSAESPSQWWQIVGDRTNYLGSGPNIPPYIANDANLEHLAKHYGWEKYSQDWQQRQFDEKRLSGIALFAKTFSAIIPQETFSDAISFVGGTITSTHPWIHRQAFEYQFQMMTAYVVLMIIYLFWSAFSP